ncbi:ferredoxin, 2Fe-2S [Flexibacter flexilis DSM 6793]|uniref:Ferredoxin, 2Fe-2S n=1 Tax=Flexibacter flexilis DSM 6793 TaxID=927664 RepID=A0A1I1I0E2_9BACT|nr:2Fe-2S iron-sulfur cluster-binding protein [Flexibacter flexilis]SFC29787.1 ferredoxin, 2Fe-2S [Flexibacter flexilis DSM 6793]
MPKVVIKNLKHKEFTFENSQHTILQGLQAAGQDFMFACGGKGRCTTCRVRVLEGAELLSELTAAEYKFATQGRLQPDERLTCQAQIITNHTTQHLVLYVPKPCQLPHLEYNE